MKPLTTPEQAQQNADRFNQLLEEAAITQQQAADMITEQTSRPCSVRSVRSWLNDPAKPSWRPCPDWAVLALETRIQTLKLKQR
jgi:hypothetical protein